MNVVKISKKKPPQWILDKVKEMWGIEWDSQVIFTYGDVISTSQGYMTEDLLAHERHHIVQQEKFGGPDKWWEEYFNNEEFRLQQELECYRKQYQWLKQNCKNAQERFKFLQHYARSLSSELYGGLINFHTAMKEITK